MKKQLGIVIIISAELLTSICIIMTYLSKKYFCNYGRIIKLKNEYLLYLGYSAMVRVQVVLY